MNGEKDGDGLHSRGRLCHMLCHTKLCQARFVFGLLIALVAAWFVFLLPVSRHPASMLTLQPTHNSWEGMPGGDTAFWLWTTWWSGEAIADLKTSPYYCRWQNSPDGVSLAFTPIAAPYSILGRAFHLPPVVIYNLFTAVVVILTAFGAALIALEMGYGRSGAIIAAALMFLTPFQRAQMVNHLNIVSTCWPVLTIYFVLRMKNRGGLLNVLAASFFAALTFFTSHYHAFFLATILCLYVVWQIIANRNEQIRRNDKSWVYAPGIVLWFVGLSFSPLLASAVFFAVLGAYLVACLYSRRKEARVRAHALRFGLFVIVAAVLSSPLLLPLLTEKRAAELDFSASLPSKIYFANTPLTPFLTPALAAKLNRALGIDEGEMWRFKADEEFASFPGWAALALTVIVLARLRRKATGGLWAFLAVCAYILSLGVMIRFPALIAFEGAPYTGIVMPAALTYLIPGFRDIRVLSRYGFYFDLALVLFVAANLKLLVRSFKSRQKIAGVAIVVAVILITGFERFEGGLPVLKVKVPVEFQTLAGLPEGACWSLPDTATPQALFGQTIHEHPLVNSMTSRQDPRYAETRRSSVAWQVFTSGEFEDMIAVDEGLAEAIRAELKQRKVRYVVLMKDQMRPEYLEELSKMLRNKLRLREIIEGEGLRVFGV